jgi:hypothetical protein
VLSQTRDHPCVIHERGRVEVAAARVIATTFEFGRRFERLPTTAIISAAAGPGDLIPQAGR